MIYSYLKGRLGNILFEIAAGASLAKRRNVPFKAFRNMWNNFENQFYVILIFRMSIQKIRKYIKSRLFPIDLFLKKVILYCTGIFNRKDILKKQLSGICSV